MRAPNNRTRHNDVRDLLAPDSFGAWPDAPRYDGVLVIAHRGAASVSPWNSLDAIRDARRWGADGVELDIRCSSDGILYLFHDDCLDLHTDGVGSPYELSYGSMCALQHRSDLGERIEAPPPRLADALDLCAELELRLHLDVKEPNLEGAIAESLSARGLWNRVVSINSYNAELLRADPRFRELDYKGPLYHNREEYFAEQVRAMLQQPGKMVIVDDPRYVAALLGRRPAPRLVRGKPESTGLPRSPREGSGYGAPPHAPLDESSIRSVRAALDEAGTNGDPEAVRALRALALRTPIGAPPTVIAEVGELLASYSLAVLKRPDWRTDGVVEAAALRTLGDFGIAGAASAALLRRAVRWERHDFHAHLNGSTGARPGWWRIRDEAIRSTGRSGGPDGAQVLLEYLQPDRMQKAKSGNARLAGSALGLIRNSGGVDGTPMEEVVRNAIEALPAAARGSYWERIVNAEIG